MAYKNKTYVCFEAGSDIGKYNLMKAWKQNDNTNFNFHNAHDLNNLRDGSTEETIKKKLRERLVNTKAFIVLVGKKTKTHYKFVRWEIEQAVKLDIPIIIVNLNNERCQDDTLCPPIIKDKLAVHVSFSPKIIQHALENWTDEYYTLKNKGTTGPRIYNDEVYKKLGISI
jgi:hypothetical protein